MGYDLRRAATALLACLAVALAAMLLPAAGIGSYPGVVGEPVPGAGPDGGTGPGVDPSPDDTSGDDPTGEETTGETESDSDSDDGTDTTTQEQSSTADGGSTGGSDSGGDLLAGAVGFLVVLLQAVTLFALLGTGLLVLGLIVGGLNAGPVRLLSRDGSGGGMLLEVFGTQVSLGGLQTLSQGSLRLVLGLSRSTGTLLSGLGKAAGDAVSALSTGGSLVASVGSAFGALGGGLARALKSGGVVGSLTLGLESLTTGLANWGPSFDRGDSPTSDARGAGPVPDPEASEEDEPVDPGPQSVEEAWERFVERVPLRRPEVRTPGEVARTAVRNDWPAGPVRRLTHAFREVRYGGAPADEGRTRGATSALDRMDDGGEGE